MPVLVPRIGERLDPDLPEPVSPVDDCQRHKAERDRLPGATHLANGRDLRVVAAVALADGFGDVGNVHQGIRVQVRPAVQHLNDIRACPPLNRRDSPGLHVGGMDGFDGHRNPRSLLKFTGKLAMDLVGFLDKAGRLQEVKGCPLCKGRGLSSGDNVCDSPRQGNPRDNASCFDKLSSRDGFH